MKIGTVLNVYDTQSYCKEEGKIPTYEAIYLKKYSENEIIIMKNEPRTQEYLYYLTLSVKIRYWKEETSINILQGTYLLSN